LDWHQQLRTRVTVLYANVSVDSFFACPPRLHAESPELMLLPLESSHKLTTGSMSSFLRVAVKLVGNTENLEFEWCKIVRVLQLDHAGALTPYFLSRLGVVTGVPNRNRERASPIFWMNASEV
jgi:hypothetical protein